MLDTDLTLIKKPSDSSNIQGWIRKKYPQVLASMLIRNVPRRRRIGT
jgi:hypothetical protein